MNGKGSSRERCWRVLLRRGDERLPDGIRSDAKVRRRLLEEYGIEIGGGLGVMAGKAWRIGLMGHGATVRNVDIILAALRAVMA